VTKRDRYIYPAIFHRGVDGISVHFPNLPGALTCGDTYEEAFEMAIDCLALHLRGMEADGDEILEPTPVAEIITEADETVQLIYI
jgi:predicted RNase H-like HicB family nuclease